MGVARLELPPSFAGCAYSAEQNFDTATITVNLTSPAKVTVSLTVFVSPLAPVIWTKLTATGNAAPLAITLNTTVRTMFYHRDSGFKYNATFPLQTTASCGADSTDAGVSRSAEFAGSDSINVVGAIHHSVRAPSAASTPAAGTPATCAAAKDVGGRTSTELGFSLEAGERNAVTVATVVRTTRDPGCVARPVIGSAPLCGLATTDATSAAVSILADLTAVTQDQAQREHAASWEAFWNVSGVSMPDAPETEDFWYGAQSVLNQAIPHRGQVGAACKA